MGIISNKKEKLKNMSSQERYAGVAADEFKILKRMYGREWAKSYRKNRITGRYENINNPGYDPTWF